MHVAKNARKLLPREKHSRRVRECGEYVSEINSLRSIEEIIQTLDWAQFKINLILIQYS